MIKVVTPPCVYVRDTETARGRGVFAARAFGACPANAGGETIRAAMRMTTANRYRRMMSSTRMGVWGPVLVLNTREVKPCVDKKASVSGRPERRQERRQEVPPRGCGWKTFSERELHEAPLAAAITVRVRRGVRVNAGSQSTGQPGVSAEKARARDVAGGCRAAREVTG